MKSSDEFKGVKNTDADVRTCYIKENKELCSGPNCSGYRGIQTNTRSGKTCQRWDAQTPQMHGHSPSNHPTKGLEDNNFCRNPSDNPVGIWCYTTDAASRWEYCNPIDKYTTQPGQCKPASGRATVDVEFKEIVSKIHDSQCFPLCNQDPFCYGFHYDEPNSKCILVKFPDQIMGVKDDATDARTCYIKGNS